MANCASLYPIHALANEIDDEPFDHRVLPFQVINDVAIEDISRMFRPETFNWCRHRLGEIAVEELQGVRYALVHRYEGEGGDGPRDADSEKLIRNAAACLRLIRPMRQRALLMRGILRDGEVIDIRHVEHPIHLEVPEVQKLFQLRNRDAELLRQVLPPFLVAMNGELGKFRMAVEFHEAGHFQNVYWKARYLLWCSAIEAIFTSQHPEHRTSYVSKERIRWFLGENTSIYEPGDIPDFAEQANITIGEIIDDLYTIRNAIAHGDPIPNTYRERILRQDLNEPLNAVGVLLEAVSFIVRKSLLRIIQKELFQHFMRPSDAEAYFGDAGLTRTQIRNRMIRNHP